LHGEIFISNKASSSCLYRVRDVTDKRTFLHRILSDSGISFLDKEFSAWCNEEGNKKITSRFGDKHFSQD